MNNKILICIFAFVLSIQCALAGTFYVATTGNDTSGDGSAARPWRTLKHAASKVPANAGHTILLAAGTFVEAGPVEIPAGVNVAGAGKTLTILKAAPAFYYYPASPGYATEKFLISLKASSQIPGNQTLRDFTVDGDGKKLHGGIYVRYRNGVTIERVKVQGTNFTGIWLWDVKDSKILHTDLINCSWGSSGYCVGALNLGNLERVEIDQLNVDESVGYGIKAIGPNGYNDLLQLKIHDSRISVHPTGLWNNGSAPNIAIELWQVNLVGCEIYNTYVDNTISLVNSNANPSTGVQTIRVHHNTLDMDARAKGAGYGIELTIHDAEIDHNYFYKGRYGIANWDNPMQNWNIHHNTFYALEGVYPGDIVRSQWSGLHNVNFYNNTIEFAGTKTMNVIGVYGGASKNVNVINNLLINNNTAYSYYPNSLIHMENGATLSSLSVKNNLFDRLAQGNVAGTYSGNLTGDPGIIKTGSRPEYYTPASGSRLIDGGLNLLSSFLGLAPDIGAIEYTSSLLNLKPQVSLTEPANNASFPAGTSVILKATASDVDGSISKVEFYRGTTKLGEDFNSPYSFEWKNTAAGNYSLTARATDNKGAVTTSGSVAVNIVASNQPPAIAISSPNDGAQFSAGATVNITASASDPDGTVAKVEFFNGTTLLGTDATSPYGFSWTNIPEGTHSVIAKATDNTGAVTTSGSIAINVLKNNQAPTVTISSPANGAEYAAGATVNITASASDPDGTVAKVEFFNGTTLLGTDVTSPYGFSWTNIPDGTHSVLAKATDNTGAVTTSGSVAITVLKNNQAPAITISSPANGAEYAAGATVNITVSASDPDGTVAKVEFFNGTTLLGTDGISPYEFSWTNIPEGTHAIHARATDDDGAVGQSPVISLTVSGSRVLVGLYAPDATLSGNMRLTSDATTSKGSYFAVPAGYGTNHSIPPASKAEFNFTVPETGTYVAWVRIKSPTSNNQGYHIYDGKGNWTSWLAGVHTEWTWVKVTDAYTNEVATFPFTAGANIFRMAWFHDNAQVDRILITNDLTYYPTDAPIPGESGPDDSTLWLYAQDASLTGSMSLSEDVTALGGSYFSVPAGNGKNYTIPPSSSAQFSFNIARTGNYFAWVRVKSPTITNQGFHVYDGKGNWTTWLTGVFPEWTWLKITDAYTSQVAFFPYSAGQNHLRLSWFHDNTMVDAVVITDDPQFVPDRDSSAARKTASTSTAEGPESDPEISAFPNPVKDKLTINYTSASAQSAQLSIKSATSLSARQMNVDLLPGSNTIEVDMQNEPRGMYLLFINAADGKGWFTKIMVVK